MIGSWKELGMDLFDGKQTGVLDGLCVTLDSLARSSGIGYPFFLRTGHFSGKHDWENTCYVKDKVDIRSNLIRLANMEVIVGASAGAVNPFCVWVVREMLPTKPRLVCTAYGNFPIARELRVFVDGSRVAYHVPYWPDGAIEEGSPKELDWAEKLNELQSFSADELAELCSLASRAGGACRGRWSVDLLETDCGWYITDMAEAEKSYGYDPDNKGWGFD